MEQDERSHSSKVPHGVSCSCRLGRPSGSFLNFPNSFQHAIRENADAIANSIVLEQGKTFTDAHGDLHRGLQVVQAATSITTTLMGNKIEGKLEQCFALYLDPHVSS